MASNAPFGAYVKAQTSSDGSTSLVVDGLSHSLFGEQVVTVGVGGRFATLKDACDYIATQSYMDTLHTGSYTAVDGAKILTASAAIPAAVTGRLLFLQHATDDFLYPIDVTVPGTSTKFKPFYPMWGRSAGATDFSIVSPSKTWTIVMLPGRHQGDSTPVTVPKFTTIVGYGKNVTHYEDEVSAINRGIIEIPSTSQFAGIKGVGIQHYSNTNRGASILLPDVGTDVITTGQRLEFNDISIASTGASEDGIWKLAVTKNVIDAIYCNNVVATGYYDSFALFNTVRTRVENCEIVSINSDQDLPQCISVSGNSLVNSDHRIYGNLVRAYNEQATFSASTVGVKLSATTAGTKNTYVKVSDNQIECVGESNVTPGLESVTHGISISESGVAVGDIVVHSSNNIFACSGAGLNYAISSGASGVVYSTNDRNKGGSAITTTTSAGGALTVVL